MHEYTLSNHDRKGIYYYAAILSSLLGGAIAFLISEVNSLAGIILAAPSGFAIFHIIFKIFDSHLWNIEILYKLGAVKIPDINGEWDATITSSSSTEPINASITISQTYTKLRVRLDTNKSQSLSQMAAIEMVDNGCYKLKYEYLAEFHKDDSTTLRHHGVSELILKSDTAKFDQSYNARFYTEMDRDTSGQIVLRKRHPNEK